MQHLERINKSMFQKHIFRWSLVFMWMALIFYFSHQAGSESSSLSGGITEFLLQPFHLTSDQMSSFHTFIRKTAHFTVYFILGLLLFHAIQVSTAMKRTSLAFSIAILYAASDEFHQTFIPGRSGELRDVAIDSVGSLTGILTYFLCMMIIKNARLQKA